MTPEPIDQLLEQLNPWGLTQHQCMSLRLYCKYGSAKRVANTIGTSQRNIEGHIRFARKRVGLFGSDIRLFVIWDRWSREQIDYLKLEEDKP